MLLRRDSGRQAMVGGRGGLAGVLDGSLDEILGWQVTLLRGVYVIGSDVVAHESASWRGSIQAWWCTGRLVGGAPWFHCGGSRCCGNGCSGPWRRFRATVVGQPV